MRSVLHGGTASGIADYRVHRPFRAVARGEPRAAHSSGQISALDIMSEPNEGREAGR